MSGLWLDRNEKGAKRVSVALDVGNRDGVLDDHDPIIVFRIFQREEQGIAIADHSHGLQGVAKLTPFDMGDHALCFLKLLLARCNTY